MYFLIPGNPETIWRWKVVITIVLESIWISFLLLCNKLQKTQWLKTTPIYYFIISVSQNLSGCNWVLCFMSHRMDIKVSVTPDFFVVVLGLIHFQTHSGCSFHFTSVAQSWPTLCDPMDCSTPGFLAHHQLLEFTQTHVHSIK